MKKEQEMNLEKQEPYKLKMTENRLPEEFLKMYPDMTPEEMTNGFVVTAETADDWALFSAAHFDGWGLEDATIFHTHKGVKGKTVEDMRKGAEKMVALLSEKSFQDKLLAAGQLYSSLNQAIMLLEDQIEDLREADSAEEAIADLQKAMEVKIKEKDAINNSARRELYGAREKSTMGSL